LQDTIAYYRARYRGTLIANGGFDSDTADSTIRKKIADIVSFATPFIGNPDLVERFRDGLSISSSDPKTYYQGDARGYIDYPAVQHESSPST
jgi:N-ethylmaleimide reductase